MWTEDEALHRVRSLELVQPRHGGMRGGRPKPVPPVTKPGPAELDAAEAALGVPLPRSYRAFCLELGPGMLRDHIRIYAPCSEVPLADLVKYGEHWREFDDSHRHGESWWRPYSFPVNDLVAFADTMGGDVFGFHPKEPTVRDEYAIYCIPREPDLGPDIELERVAESFPGFLEAEAFNPRLVNAPNTWEPFGVPRRRHR